MGRAHSGFQGGEGEWGRPGFSGISHHPCCPELMPCASENSHTPSALPTPAAHRAAQGGFSPSKGVPYRITQEVLFLAGVT